jgi:hypothetical protein
MQQATAGRRGRRPGTAKTGGRVRGTPNAVTRDVRLMIAQFAERKAVDFESWIERTAVKDPAKAATLYLAAIEYHIPRLQRTEVRMAAVRPSEPIKPMTAQEAADAYAQVMSGDLEPGDVDFSHLPKIDAPLPVVSRPFVNEPAFNDIEQGLPSGSPGVRAAAERVEAMRAKAEADNAAHTMRPTRTTQAGQTAARGNSASDAETPMPDSDPTQLEADAPRDAATPSDQPPRAPPPKPEQLERTAANIAAVKAFYRRGHAR